MDTGISPGLRVSFVEKLEDIVQPVVDYLNSAPDGRDLFDVDHIIVPNAGVRAWLLQHIATKVGVSKDQVDGIAANVNIGYVGMIRQLAGQTQRQNDPWEIEPLTIAVLDCLDLFPFAPALCERYGGALRAARAIADKFDVYHARRPQMIDAWEQGRALLAPQLGKKISEGEWEILQPALDEQDKWQFNLWTKVRAHIGVPSPPAQMNALVRELQDGSVMPGIERLLIVGLQSLDVRNIHLVNAMAAHIPVEVVLVHPSPALAQKWQPEAENMAGAFGTLSIRPKDAVMEDGVHSLLSSWLQSTHEAQVVMGGFEIAPIFIERASPSHGISRLSLLQQAVANTPHVPSVVVPSNDRSLQIHRAHNLSRQVEILHDALLHAFAQIPQLEPHEIVILCADMAASAPILESIFGREVKVVGEDGATRTVTIPLVVADRSLREVSEGARLLAALLQVVGSRASRTSVMGLLAVDAVLSNVSLNREVLDTWNQLLDRTGLQWGFDAGHRAHKGLASNAGEAYSWLAAVQQSLLGVLVPDAKPQPELGGVVPLDDLDTADVHAVAALSYVVSLLSDFEKSTRVEHSIAEWCSMVEEMLVSLCGEDSDSLSEPIDVLGSLRASSQMIGTGSSTKVLFDEFASIVVERVEATPGRQPLRTGAVTATSFVPLRSVPFRVVCVLGYDDAAVSAKDLEGDDLSGRQRFAGTSDSRIDSRRNFLDAMLAAQDRFIVTCIGKSIKNNASVPFITPLAEFVDMCIDADALDLEAEKKMATFVYEHPRHAISATNFIKDEVVPGVVWGHSVASFEASSVIGEKVSSNIFPIVKFRVEPLQEVTIDDLVKVLDYPEDFFLATIGVSKWRDKVLADEAVLPLEITDRRERELWDELRDMTFAADHTGVKRAKKFVSEDSAAWKQVRKARGAVSVGVIGEKELQYMATLFDEMNSTTVTWGFPSLNETVRDAHIELPNGVVDGEVSYFESDELIGMAGLRDVSQLRVRAAITLLILAAEGTPKHSAIVFGYDFKEQKIKVNSIFFEKELSQAEALRRLSKLIDSINLARSIPAVKCEGTVAAILTAYAGNQEPDEEACESIFEDFVGSDKYGTSLERKLFGEEPKFSAVFEVGGPMREFWIRRTDAFSGPKYKSYAKHLITTIKVSGYPVK